MARRGPVSALGLLVRFGWPFMVFAVVMYAVNGGIAIPSGLGRLSGWIAVASGAALFINIPVQFIWLHYRGAPYFIDVSPGRVVWRFVICIVLLFLLLPFLLLGACLLLVL